MKKEGYIPDSELIINSDGSAFHIHLRPETVRKTGCNLDRNQKDFLLLLVLF